MRDILLYVFMYVCVCVCVCVFFGWAFLVPGNPWWMRECCSWKALDWCWKNEAVVVVVVVHYLVWLISFGGGGSSSSSSSSCCCCCWWTKRKMGCGFGEMSFWVLFYFCVLCFVCWIREGCPDFVSVVVFFKF